MISSLLFEEVDDFSAHVEVHLHHHHSYHLMFLLFSGHVSVQLSHLSQHLSVNLRFTLVFDNC